MNWGIIRKHRISDEEAFQRKDRKPSFLEFKTEGPVPRPRGKLVAEPGLGPQAPGFYSALGSSPSSNMTGVEREERREFLA